MCSALAVGACAEVVGADFGDYRAEEPTGPTTGAGGGATTTGMGASGQGGLGAAGGAAGGAGGAGAPDVLVVHNSSSPSIDSIVPALLGTGDFASVTLFDGGASVPQLSTLEAADAILLANQSTWLEASTLGDVMQQYFDGGGRVVGTALSFCDQGLAPLEGAFVSAFAFAPGALVPAGTVGALPDDPLFDGVPAFSTSPDYCAVTLASGAVALGTIGSAPLAARRSVGGRERVDVNLLYSDADAATIRLLANALLGR